MAVAASASGLAACSSVLAGGMTGGIDELASGAMADTLLVDCHRADATPYPALAPVAAAAAIDEIWHEAGWARHSQQTFKDFGVEDLASDRTADRADEEALVSDMTAADVYEREQEMPVAFHGG